jgi:hypothetical protein
MSAPLAFSAERLWSDGQKSRRPLRGLTLGHRVAVLLSVAIFQAPLRSASWPQLPMAMGAQPAAFVRDPRGSETKKLYFQNIEQAARACGEMAKRMHGVVMRTSGTASMLPFINDHPTFVIVKKEPFDSIKKSDILVYMGRLDGRRPERTCALHRAVQLDDLGWIMSGDNNRWTESWDRVTPENYLGKVVMIFES